MHIPLSVDKVFLSDNSFVTVRNTKSLYRVMKYTMSTSCSLGIRIRKSESRILH